MNALMHRLAAALPRISATERTALEAGDVWWEGALFSGNPDPATLLGFPPPRLSEAEQAFLDGPLDALCRDLDDWQITHEAGEIPAEIWARMRAIGLFGLIVPRRYGGLEFSAHAHSCVVMKLAARSFSAAVTAMVPNSLGPAKLLLEYGTEAQRTHYLPRLASGEDLPCFALTAPEAGSDAASISDRGIVCRATHGGREVIGIRLNFSKRYITLAPVATVIGLAFRLYDPQRLLPDAAGHTADRGISVALLAADTPGVTIGRRHFPLNAAFANGPIQGRNVFVPLDALIGGAAQAGQGWRMLVESLADGRGISLPALATGAAKLAVRAGGAYTLIRRQFHLPLAQLEGVREALTEIAGETYILAALRGFTTAALDAGLNPAVCTAIAKYQATARMRRVIEHSMDIQAGRGICLGPRNLFGRIYQAVPIGITVEGANILTRSLIVFGQGAVRAHPWLRRELDAIEDGNAGGLARALLGHLSWALVNAVRAVSRAWFSPNRSPAPGDDPDRALRHGLRQLRRYSAAFALVADLSLLRLGGALKRRERLSGRLADVLADLYLASAVLKRFADQGRPAEDLPLLAWALRRLFGDAQTQLRALLANQRGLRWLAPVLVPHGQAPAAIDDALAEQLAELAVTPGAARERLTAGLHRNTDPDDAQGRIERAYTLSLESADAERRLARGEAITAAAHASVRAAIAARWEAIQVDDFPADFLRRTTTGDDSWNRYPPTAHVRSM